nr:MULTISPECIES: PAS domain S-box protein [unclassified Leptolyngbya]
MGVLMRSLDWSQTPLGSIETWSQSLRTSISICLSSRFPILLWWGTDLVMFYNDAYQPILGTKHPKSMGQRGRDCWSEVWDVIGPMLEGVLLTGEATWSENQVLLLDRHGYIEECYFTFSYSPIADETGGTGGVFTAVTETTRQVIGERRLQTLRDLAADTAKAKTVEEAYKAAIAALASNINCIPFALLYRIESDDQAHLVGATGLEAETLASPGVVDLSRAQEWPFQPARATRQPQRIENLRTRFGELFDRNGTTIAHDAILLPLTQAGDKQRVVGFLVLGISPKLAFDPEYQSFFDLVTGNVETAIANVEAYEAERQRAEALAELDRAKTTFFSNVSHELRTPLTLMLEPLGETLNRLNGQLPAVEQEQLQMVQRNGQRLLKLVNTLLDFSRIEVDRMAAVYEPTDLAAFTTELASVFRSAIAQANLSLIVDCPPLAAPAWVDQEMWEKIVLNLLSNAFKFTLKGEIVVVMRERHDQIELEVRDTGIGISPDELPHIFERFYRVREAKGRTYEGTGIGLSLVQELVWLHGGTIDVKSVVGQGTCFTVSIPTGYAHLPQNRIGVSRTLDSTATGTKTWVQEFLHWLPEEGNGRQDGNGSSSPAPISSLSSSAAARILLVDDNRDMRDYVRRLLFDQGYTVETAIDGRAALVAIEQQQPDLILADVMMPQLDGFGLLRELRANPSTREIPIILLSARAGEEACIEGLEVGADDYLTKPFSARELLARVEATLKLSQLRQVAGQQEQLLRQQAEAARQQVETILSSIQDGFFVLNRNWHYTYANDRFCELAGKSREELLGYSYWKLFPDAIDTEAYVQFHQAMSEQTPLQFEHLYLPWNRWFEYRVYPSPEGLTIFAAEVTERKQAQQRVEFLTELSQKLGTVTDVGEINRIVTHAVGTFFNGHRCYYLDVAPDGNHVTVLPDWRLDGPDLAGTYNLALFGAEDWWKTAAQQPFGIDDVTVHPWTKDFVDNYMLINMQSYAIAPFVREGHWVASIGVSFNQPRCWTVDELLLLENVVARVVPIIERARVEAALRQSEEKYRSLFNSMDEGYVLAEMIVEENDQLDAPGTVPRATDILYLEANPATVRMLGQDFTGRRLREFNPNAEEHWYEIFGRVAQTGIGERSEQYAKLTETWYDCYTFKVGDEHSRKIAIVFNDITARKQAELEIQKFVSLADNSTEFIGMCDLDLVPFYANQAALQLVGLEDQQYKETPVNEFFFPEDQDFIVNEVLPRVLQDGWAEVEIRFRHFKTGEAIWMIYNVFYIRDANNQPIGLATVSRNISSRKQAEADRQKAELALREANVQLESALAAGAVYTWRWDIPANQILVNATLAQLFGLDPAILTPTGVTIEVFTRSIHSEDRPRVLAAMQQAIETGDVFTAEYRVYNATGEVRWVTARGQVEYDAAGNAIAFLGALADITERKRAEEDRDRFFQLSYDMLAIVHMDGYFVHLNPAWTKILGYSIETLIGQSYIAFVHPDDRARTIAEAKVLAEGSPTIGFENRYCAQDGSYHWISWNVVPSVDQKLLYCVARDVTERKQVEAEREQLLIREQTAREEAERANRIKDEFLAVLSHELRSPLNPILGWSRLLQSGKLDQTKTAQALATIERNAKLQSELIEDLLDVSRILSGKLSLNVFPVHLTAIIEGALETVQLAAEVKSISIEVSLAPNVEPVLGDSTRLQQVVWNLLSNAVKFTPEGGNVCIRLERIDSFAQMTVSDTGQGIESQFLPYVFDHFRQANSTTTRHFGGLGLGLAIVRYLVELHGGTVGVESAGAGQGATFTVRLPLLLTPSTRSQDEQLPEPSLNLSGIQILVVDDEIDARELLVFLLEQQGAQVVAATSAHEALLLLSQSKPDILISDIGMPDMDGYMLIQHVRMLTPEQGGQIPAIALTAYAGEMNQQQALTAGFQKHISKPIESEILIHIISSLIKT